MTMLGTMVVESANTRTGLVTMRGSPDDAAHIAQMAGEVVEVMPLARADRLLASEIQWDTLFDAIKHGSPEHQEWLEKAIDDHRHGRPVELSRG